MAAPWTDDEVSNLRKMFRDGKSDAEIARELGKTLNSVIGERNRRGLKRITHDRRHRERSRRKASDCSTLNGGCVNLS